MNRRRAVLAALAGVVPALALLWAVGGAGAQPFAAEDTDLNPSGQAFEINIDQNGMLWISDFFADEVRHIDPATGAYTIYQGLDGASDARPDGAGSVWWTGYNGNLLGRIALTSNLVTTWTLPGAGSPLGTAVDAAGNVWLADSFEPQLHRFEPNTTQVCTYLVPAAGNGDYLAAKDGLVWFGDWYNARIARLDPAANLFTTWQLPGLAYPEGVAVADGGAVWVADSQLGVLARLEPSIGQLSTYTLPVGASPEMVALAGGSVWYTEAVSGTVGALDPAAAEAVTSTLTVSDLPVTPDCSVLGPGTSAPAVTSTGTAIWVTTTLTSEVDSGGWAVYSLPSGSSPWGIAFLNEVVYVVDQGRQKLVRISAGAAQSKVHLPLIMR